VTEISHSSVRPPSQQTPGQQGGQAVDFEVVITLDDPPPTLRPDLSATADVITSTANNALSVPIIGLTVRDRGEMTPVPQEDPDARAAARDAAAGQDVEGVFIVRNGVAHFVAVKIGIAGRDHFEVLSGVSEGDSVIAGPYEAIRSLTEGDKVRRMVTPATGAAGRSGSK
jgi:HlyD family secretion protein